MPAGNNNTHLRRILLLGAGGVLLLVIHTVFLGIALSHLDLANEIELERLPTHLATAARLTSGSEEMSEPEEFFKAEDLAQMYAEVYNLTNDGDTKTFWQDKQWPDFGQRKAMPANVLQTTYDAHITTCSITVFVLDPRVADPSYGYGKPFWFALESVGAYVDYACVALLTSSCAMQEYVDGLCEPATKDGRSASHLVRDHIYRSSLPKFRQMIDGGKVRVSYIDHQKYKLKSCTDFGNPSKALMNRDFWRDEFVTNVDSDQVILFQDDSVFCRRSDLSQWSRFAYVGAVWANRYDMYEDMPDYWRMWLKPQRQWEESHHMMRGAGLVEPRLRLNETFPGFVNGVGPVGNGGLSSRLRSWMIKAIETCPHDEWSGLDPEDEYLACQAEAFVNEDIYFGVVLQGMRALLPTAVEASSFSVETIFPEDVHEMYPGGDANILSALPKFSYEEGSYSMPLGLHQVWEYHPIDMITSYGFSQHCLFLQYILPKDDFFNRYWADLNGQALEAAALLGYDQELWDNSAPLPIYSTPFRKLGKKEQEAVTYLGLQSSFHALYNCSGT